MRMTFFVLFNKIINIHKSHRSTAKQFVYKGNKHISFTTFYILDYKDTHSCTTVVCVHIQTHENTDTIPM